MRRPFVLTFLLVMAACGGGAAGEDPPPSSPVGERPATASDLVGVWGRVAGTHKALFNADGSFAIDQDGLIYATPAAEGTYELDEGTITFTSAGSDVCQEGDLWAWEASILDDGRLRTVVVDDGQGYCHIGIGTEWTWRREPEG